MVAAVKLKQPTIEYRLEKKAYEARAELEEGGVKNLKVIRTKSRSQE